MKRDLSELFNFVEKEIQDYENLIRVIKLKQKNEYIEAKIFVFKHKVKISRLTSTGDDEEIYQRIIDFLRKLTIEKMQEIIANYENPHKNMDEVCGTSFYPLQLFILSFVPKESAKKRRKGKILLRYEELKNEKKAIDSEMNFEDDNNIPPATYKFIG